MDKGEASAITLCLETENSKLIIDEIKGRKIAISMNISIIGTVGIFLLAYKKGLIPDLELSLNELKSSGFYISDKIIEKAIQQSQL